MKGFRLSLLVLIFFLAPAMSQAGEIYGTIKEGGKPVGPGVKVTINSGEKSYSRETDTYSSYRAYIRETGPVKITVEYKGQKPSTDASSYEGAVRFNLVLEQKGGSYSLRKE
jgi:hypothetical protein